MARLLPELLVDEDRRADLLVAAAGLELAHRALERPPDHLALRVPEGRARRYVVEAVQVELDAEPAVIALLRLGPPPQVLVELLLGRPDRAVDALEHRPLLVAAPVRAGDGEQLERAELAGALDVRPLAEVDERAVLVDRHRRHRRAVGLRLRGEVVEDLDLERLVALGEEGPALVRRQLAADERVVGGDALRHPRLDRGEVVGLERPVELEVVVEAVLDGRPDAELGPGEEVEDGLGHDVGGRVAHRVERVAGAGVEQLLGRAALGRGEVLGRVSSASSPTASTACCARSAHRVRASRESRNLSSIDRTRGPILPRFHPPSRRPVPAHLRALAALSGGSRAGSPAAHGWCVVVGGRRASSLRPGSLVAPSRRRVSRSTRLRSVMVGDTGLEPVTSCMSSKCSNQLS